MNDVVQPTRILPSHVASMLALLNSIGLLVKCKVPGYVDPVVLEKANVKHLELPVVSLWIGTMAAEEP